jgi:hypothetical protein
MSKSKMAATHFVKIWCVITKKCATEKVQISKRSEREGKGLVPIEDSEGKIHNLI